MKYIHPFPARMAPEIITERIKKLKPGQKILDPMVGSGMVLNSASRYGLKSYGVDTDPLAVLISNTTSTKVKPQEARNTLEKLIENARSCDKKNIELSWIDSDDETSSFIRYWFGKSQIEQLRRLAFWLIQEPMPIPKTIKNVLLISISRLIVTKEPKASLAKDSAHSRPHKTISKSSFDVFSELPKSLEYVLSVLKPEEIMQNSKVRLGDARNMSYFENEEFDSIITSPPYFNAIDYLRGHKLSLVWFGYTIRRLREIRAKSIGSAKGLSQERIDDYKEAISGNRYLKNTYNGQQVVKRYILDLNDQLNECYRVLKENGEVTLVIGNCEVNGKEVDNNEIVKSIARKIGFKKTKESERELPDYKRYLPITTAKNNCITRRMHKEIVLTLKK
jgi:DNA modification methylase